MLTNAAFKDFRNLIKKRIAKAEYKVGSTWYQSQILETVIMDDGVVRVKTQIAHGAACTIKGVRLISKSGDVWAEKTVNVVLQNSYTHLLQWFDFNISESEVS